MTEDFLERLRMADQDDDDTDLKQLKQLRQVWLAMPEEEPPMKGLDALMAAARTKAEEMKPAPWWKRMFAVMVRPPALALATIVVVAGGAILVHNHRDEVESVQVANQDVAVKREEAPAVAPPTTPDPGMVAAGSAAPTQETEKVTLDAKQALPEKPVAHHAGTTKKKSSPSAGSKGDAFRGDDGVSDKLMLSQQTAPPPPPPPPPKQTVEKPPVEKPVDMPVAKAPMPTSNSAGPSGSSKDSNAQPMAAQLLAKARAAAERNDCAAVKQLLEQIAKLDGAYYRTTAAKDATVGRCMQIAD